MSTVFAGNPLTCNDLRADFKIAKKGIISSNLYDELWDLDTDLLIINFGGQFDNSF